MLSPNQIIQSDLEKYQVVKKLYGNAIRAVYLVQKESDKKEYILKSQPYPDVGEGELRLINDQLKSLQQFDGLVKYYEAFLQGEIYYTVQEYCKGGDVNKLLKIGQPRLERTQIYDIILDVCKSLKQLDSLGLFHRDIKPSNIVIYIDSITQKKTYKLCDYGEVRQNNLINLTGNVGTPQYQAREIVDGSIENYDNKVDIWSLGAVIYELFEQTALFDEVNRLRLQNQIADQDPADKNEKIDGLKTETYLKQLIKKMVDYDPQNRPTIVQVEETFKKVKQYEIEFTKLMKQSIELLEEKQVLLENPDAELSDYERLSQKLKDCQTKLEILLAEQSR